MLLPYSISTIFFAMIPWNLYRHCFAALPTLLDHLEGLPIGKNNFEHKHRRRLTWHRKLATQDVCQCVNLGYHRNSKQLGLSASSLQKELQKRTFWSAYAMECSAAVMLGRPLSLRFQEIDAEVGKTIVGNNFGVISKSR